MARWDESFLQGLQSGVETAIKSRQLKGEEDFRKSQTRQGLLEAYIKGLPATYTYTDPTTGETKSYSVQSNVSPEISSMIEQEIFGKTLPQPMTPTTISPVDLGQRVSMVEGSGEIPPNIGFLSQAGKVSPIKLGTKDVPAVEAQKRISGTRRFLEQFGRSYEELKQKFPEIGNVGYVGWMTRKGATIANYFDELPETKAFQVELQPLANQMARDVEGGRVTDKDRQIYADSFANTLKHPTQTNMRLASNALISMKDKGGDITSVVADLYSSEIDIMQSMAQEILKLTPDIKQKVLMKVYQNNPERFEVVNE